MQIQDHCSGVVVVGLATAITIFTGCGQPAGVKTTTQAAASQPAVAASAPVAFMPAVAEASKFAEVDGGELYYEVAGKGPTLVLIHDELLHGEAWDAQFAEFSGDYRVIRYDRRGYGRSPAATASYSDGDDLMAILEATKANRAVLIASGDGAALAAEFASNHPEMVDALVFVGPTIDGLGYSSHYVERFRANRDVDGEASITKWAEDRYLTATSETKGPSQGAELAPAISRCHTGPGTSATARERVRTMLTANPQNVSREKHRYARPVQFDAAAALSGIRLPSLILVGAEDIADVHAHAGAVEARVVGSRRIVVPGAGHLPQMEQPEACNTAIRQFLSLVARRLGHAGLGKYKSGFAPVDGGVLYYETMGRGEPLVLIHGGMVDRRMWDGQVKAFAKRYRVILYDVRGHGLSSGAMQPYRDQEDLRQLLEHLHIKRAHVMGLSLGGRIAIDFAVEHPKMVRCLIPVAPGLSGYNFLGPDQKENQQRLGEALAKGDDEQAREYMQRSWTDGPKRTPDQVDPKVRAAVREMLRFNMAAGRGMGYSLQASPPAIRRLGDIRAPTLAIVGDIDMSDILKIVDKVCEEVPEAKRVMIEGAAHMVNMENPEEFNRAVLEFLEKH